jgi:hypothetical protein
LPKYLAAKLLVKAQIDERAAETKCMYEERAKTGG